MSFSRYYLVLKIKQKFVKILIYKHDKCIYYTLSFEKPTRYQSINSINFFPLTSKPDEDECVSGTHDCHMNATCSNLPGAFSCSCNSGFTDDDPLNPGKSCTGITYLTYYKLRLCARMVD